MDNSSEICQLRVKELLRVNAVWKQDYDELLQENNQLKKELNLQKKRNSYHREDLQHHQFSSKYVHQFVDCIIGCSQSTDLQTEVIYHRTTNENEGSVRRSAEQREQKLKKKLKDSNEVMALFQRRVVTLEKRLAAKVTPNLLCCGICKGNLGVEGSKKNIDLMKSGIFPVGSTERPDERDTSGCSRNNKKRSRHGQTL